MVPRKPEERGEPFKLRKIGPESDELKGKIAEWATTHKDAVATCYEGGKFPYLDSFRDRTIDIAQPLAAVLEVAYARDPNREAARYSLMQAVSITREDETYLAEDLRVLGDLERLSRLEDPLTGTASELAARLGRKISEYELSATLRYHGFKPKSVRKGGASKYRFVLERAKLVDLLARYGMTTTEHEGSEEQAPQAAAESTS